MNKSLNEFRAGDTHMVTLNDTPTVIRIVQNTPVKIPGCGQRKWGAPVDDYDPAYDDHMLAWDEIANRPILLNIYELSNAAPANSADLDIMTRARYMSQSEIIELLRPNAGAETSAGSEE